MSIGCNRVEMADANTSMRKSSPFPNKSLTDTHKKQNEQIRHTFDRTKSDPEMPSQSDQVEQSVETGDEGDCLSKAIMPLSSCVCNLLFCELVFNKGSTKTWLLHLHDASICH